MSRLARMREQLRQLRYPPEFRITEPIRLPAPVRAAVPAEAPPTDLPDGAVAALATNLWRTKRKIDQDGSAGVSRTQRIAARHLLAAWETLEDAGVKIQDHDGLPFHPGMALDVLAYEPRPGVTGEVVLETVRPSVYRSGRCIQMGQVIVAQPEKGQGNGARNH